MPKLPSMQWRPGHDENEKGLFPYTGSDLIIKFGLWKWDTPEWAKNPKYKDWLNLSREEIDEFGTIWVRDGVKTMGHPGRPSLLDYSKLDKYFDKYTPNFNDKSRYSFAINLSKKQAQDKYRMCSLDLGPFQIASQMRGFNNLLLDQYRHKNELKLLLEYLTDSYVNLQNMWVKFGADPHGFIVYDDLGEQKGPFFSPKIFKEFYKTVYKRLFDNAHDLGCDFHLHCCGKIDPLIPLLIEWGLDSLEFDSPRMTGYPNLRRYSGKIMMWGCVNIQSIYTLGTPDECEREVWHMVRNLGTKEGGYGAYFYPQEEHIQVPKVNIEAFSKGLNKYGDYSKIPDHWWVYLLIDDWKYNEVPPLPPL